MLKQVPPRRLKVFLCYASDDRLAVRSLYQNIKNDGFDVWLDEEELIPGQYWRDVIPDAVRNSDIVIICLSHRSVNKEGYVQKEVRVALDAADEKPEDAIYLVPAKLEECIVPKRLNNLQWVDLFKDNGYEKLVKALNLRAQKLGAEILSRSNPTISLDPIVNPVAPVKQTSPIDKKKNIEDNQIGIYPLPIPEPSVKKEHGTLDKQKPQSAATGGVLIPTRNKVEKKTLKSIAMSSYLFYWGIGVFIPLPLYEVIYGILALLAGGYFIMQSELRKSFSFMTLSGFLILVGINSFVGYPLIDLINGVLALLTAGAFIMQSELRKRFSFMILSGLLIWVGIGVFLVLPLAGVIAGILALGCAIFALLGR
jgi:hypothetical protein